MAFSWLEFFYGVQLEIAALNQTFERVRKLWVSPDKWIFLIGGSLVIGLIGLIDLSCLK